MNFAQGQSVRVYPHGYPEQASIGTVVLISDNQRSIAIGFGDKPVFALAREAGIAIHPEHGVMMLACRHEVGPWIETFHGGYYEIEEAQ